MRFCPNCGSQLPETSKFCTECGEKLAAPAEKKAGGKKLLAGGIAGALVIIIIILALLLFGGGADADDPNFGIYNAVSCESGGMSLSCEGEWIELKAKGKAELFLLGEEYSAKWSFEGDKFILEQAGDKFMGSLGNGVLTIDFDGLSYTYEKEGYAAPSQPANPEQISESGYWTLLYTEGEEAMDEETVKTLKDMGIEVFMDLKPDGSGVFMMDEPMAIAWGDGAISADGESFAYAIENSQFICEIYGTKYVFVRGEGSAPKTELPSGAGEETLDSPYAWWDGQWYGWWIVSSGNGVYEEWEGYYWDCYADIEVNKDDAGYISIWDHEGSRYDTVMDCVVYFGDGVSEYGTMRAESGEMLGDIIESGDWSADPGAMGFQLDDFIMIDYRYVDPNNEDDYMDVYFFLRPWGTEWNDIIRGDDDNWPYDDMMPMYYHEWYVPLIDREYELPNSYEDGRALLAGGASEGSGDLIAGAVWDECSIEIVGAEKFVDYNGKDSIRVYYDFTNTGDDICYAYEYLSFDVTQDEYDQYPTSAQWDRAVPEENNCYLNVRPGVTIRCVAEFNMKLTGGPLVMEIYNFWDEDQRFTVEFDPQNLPGRPPEWKEETIFNPDWVENYPEYGHIGDYYVYLDHIEYAESYDFEDVLRIVLSFTNNSDEAISFDWALIYNAFQNGIQLETAYPSDDAETEADRLLYEEVQPGQSATVAVCYYLRDQQNPVEFEVSDYWSNTAIGAEYELVWGD